MKNLPLLIGSLLVTLLLVVGVAVLFSNKASVPAKAVDASILISDTPHTKGNKDAKVTVVEFSDFQCPACGAAQPLVDQMLSKYGDQVFFVYRQFPLFGVHANAPLAARAAEAADKQGAFWPFHDKLFANQQDWSGEQDPSQKFLSYATELKLNTDQFAKDLKDSALDERVTKDVRDGNTIGIAATPTFYVNGLSVTADKLLGSVDSALNGNK